MEKELPKRKPLRLKEFDYATEGAYFITICTKNRKMLFAPVGADSISARPLKKSGGHRDPPLHIKIGFLKFNYRSIYFKFLGKFKI